jgi:hypothetical protein
MPKLSKPWEIFQMIRNTKYQTSGDDVDWAVHVDHDSHTVWLLFKETNSKRDWQNNFKFPAKVYKNQESCLKVASGWGSAWKSCNEIIMSAFIKALEEHTNYSPAISGWSYGGAIALLALEDFYYRKKRFAHLITFGAPKPLWGKKTQEYVRGCGFIVKQYTHINDIVPLLPPFIGYHRLNTELCGKGRRSITKLIHPEIYHCEYGKEEIYG